MSKWVADSIEESLQDIDVNSYTQQAFKSIVTMMTGASKPAAALAGQLSKSILFPIFFLLLLLVWGVVSRALDLVSKVPVVNTLNHGLGGAIGLVKGVVVVYVVVWVLCGPAGVISPQTTQETHLLRLMTQYDPLHLLGK